MTGMDCIADFADQEVSVLVKRHLTVSYANRHSDFVSTAAIVMKGLWLEEAGFTTGTKVEVIVRNGCIVLTAMGPICTGSKTMTTLEAAEQLAAGKKFKVRR